MILDLINQWPWVLAPLIFFARVVDVSLGTFRTIIAIRGYRMLAMLVGFFESVIWVLAISQVIQNLQSWYLVLSYAAGFAVGNYVGIWLEGRVAIGQELVRAISYRGNGHLAERLRQHGYDAIQLAGDAGPEQAVEIVLAVERRRRIGRLLEVIRQEDPDAVFTISDIKRGHFGPEPVFAPRTMLAAGWRIRGRRK